MSTATIQRQYDDVIAENYDQDPQDLADLSLGHALEQLLTSGCLSGSIEPLRVLDVGMGTGLFLDKLKGVVEGEVAPFGLDLSERMLEVAHHRIPSLQSVVDDAANLHRHFERNFFDVVCTHFITGFVPIEELAPQVCGKLRPGGYWSFVGATSKAYPALQKKASSRALQLMFGNRRLDMSELLSPRCQEEVERTFRDNGLEICQAATIKPELHFENFDEFMEFAYKGGWLTPFVEDLQLQKAHRALRALLNAFVFPLRDHHTIVLGLARKPCA